MDGFDGGLFLMWGLLVVAFLVWAYVTADHSNGKGKPR
jgi:hypothetical protein